ncbi:hypothetical protein H7J87_08390 [Mycolicibacterium wolinskyi]|nr:MULTISPECIES: hypothetical protein [Mycolicibacterium]MCV7285345.1 hypothetical protein [Mycolicibacterium wolinskyi]MCV7295152.1 hypothetical protein [Mycolicibacterium goodii]
MDDGRLAAELQEMIAPGDAMISRMLAAGEHLPAIVTLVEVGVEDRVAVPARHLDAVQALIDDGAFDADDRRSVAGDLSELRASGNVKEQR